MWKLQMLPKLERLDLLVAGKRTWACEICDAFNPMPFGDSPHENVRIADIKTGEYIDETTAGVWHDWVEAHGGEVPLEEVWFTRMCDSVEEYVDGRMHEETFAERLEVVKRLRMPLPRLPLYDV